MRSSSLPEPVQLQDHVVTLDAARVAMIQDFDVDTGLMRLSGDADVSDIDVGTVIISGVVDESKTFPTAFALLIQQVVVTPGAPTYLRTGLASLTDIIASGSVVFEADLSPENVVALELPPGITPGPMFSARRRVLATGRTAQRQVRISAGDLGSANCPATSPCTRRGTPTSTGGRQDSHQVLVPQSETSPHESLKVEGTDHPLRRNPRLCGHKNDILFQ